jgi:hypothetical protein
MIANPATRSVTGFIQRVRPIPASLALVSLAFGSALLIALSSLLLVPILLATALLVAWFVSSLLLGWAGIEALAAFERWIETEVRFLR